MKMERTEGVSGVLCNCACIILVISLLILGISCDSENPVNSNIPVIGVSVKPTTSVQVGMTEQFIATIIPNTATNQGVTWASATASIATVSATGLLTGIAVGTSVVTITTVDGNFTAQCLVTVTKSIIVTGIITDIDGNVYQTVKIGNQEWMAENLRVTKYNDGSAIPQIIDVIEWANDSVGAFCYYNNTIDTDSITKFGGLYNWYSVNTGKLAPSGWSVPTDVDWIELEKYLTTNGYNWDETTIENKIGKSMAARTDWNYSSRFGTVGNNLLLNNLSGFSSLPAGIRKWDGYFHDIGERCDLWSSTEKNILDAGSRNLIKVNVGFGEHDLVKENGFSVRLVKD